MMRMQDLERSGAIWIWGVFLFGFLNSPQASDSLAVSLSTTPMTHRIYSRLPDPSEHPDYERRAVRPPTWGTFKNRTQFTCLRGFDVQADRITGYEEELEKFTRTHELGDVIWPSYPILFAKNLSDLADAIQRRDLYLFDIWGYVPGSGPGGYWQQFKPPPEAFSLLESRLGERWLGTDIGEQDGRYVGGYADQMTPASSGRHDQRLNFQRHFEKMGDELGHKHATLVSLNFGHYLLKEGTYTLIGAETAQALPNNQVYYAFIRGAGKQYGVPWFGNASIFNRWGFKTYGSSGRSDGYEHGPTKGTSLSLMKRLLYSHLLYNCVAVGFENGWFEGNTLSPIGRIQQAAQRWIRETGQPGVMHTPVALLLDFEAGWTFPRHLYSDKVYRVWGNLPYEAGDFLTDAILDMLYPGYQNSSYYHDESGFIASTPYGDIADCLLSDAPGWLLDRYAVIVVAGGLSGGQEIRDKLSAYVENGGHLILTRANLGRLPEGLAGLTTVAKDQSIPHGKGRLTVFASDFGIDMNPEMNTGLRSENDRPLPKPYSLRPEVRQVLDQVFHQQELFEAGSDDLSLITCRQSAGEYRLCVANNSWRELPLRIVSHCGEFEGIQELPLDTSEKSAVGCLPEGVDGKLLGNSRSDTIAGGDVRIFSLKVKEANVEELAHVKPPVRPRNRALPLRRLTSIKEEILARPTFFEHFDGVIVDWRSLHERETATLRRESGWIRRQGVRVYVDLSSGLNLYPGLRLIDNLAEEYSSSLNTVTNVIAKMEVLGARDLVISLHRHPENNMTGEQSQQAFEKTLKTLADHAAAHQVTLYLRTAFGKPPWNVLEAAQMLDRIGADNLRLAASTALLPNPKQDPALLKTLRPRIGLWLAAACRFDFSGRLWDAHAPIYSGVPTDPPLQWLTVFPMIPILFDGIYAGPDDEYREAVAFENLVKPR
ncbi:MAG TPA: hypothetical protein P5186_14515 [Candidatus Paceibacterota bacterium]|nr:hypothetical protein [Verrucomicrobiota bacterium]HRY49259.1 hypothetical protein [Candidatus Paceibacterota bacterium]